MFLSPFMLLHCGGGVLNQFCCNTVQWQQCLFSFSQTICMTQSVMAVTGSHTCSHREIFPAALHHCADTSTARWCKCQVKPVGLHLHATPLIWWDLMGQTMETFTVLDILRAQWEVKHSDLSVVLTNGANLSCRFCAGVSSTCSCPWRSFKCHRGYATFSTLLGYGWTALCSTVPLSLCSSLSSSSLISSHTGRPKCVPEAG